MAPENQDLEWLTVGETNAILNAISEPRDKAIITLVISTGLFMNEIIELKPTDIDWDNRILKVSGDRARELPLNDQAYTALAAWTKDRPDTPAKQFFLTTKGKVKALSARTVNHIIAKYSHAAGLNKQVNAYTLRSTFAVNLFTQGIAIDKASTLLGITDTKALHRYANATDNPAPQMVSAEDAEKLEALDTRPEPEKWLSKLLPTKPHHAKEMVAIIGPITPNPETDIFGRDSIMDGLKAGLNKGQSLLLTGRLGIGKSHILQHLASQLQHKVLFLDSPTPMKETLSTLCESLYPDGLKAVGTRPSTKEILEYISTNPSTQNPILIIDNLDKLKTSDLEVFTSLLETFTILGATETTKPALKQIWWKFKQVELQPLNQKTTKELIQFLTKNLSIKTYKSMETKIVTVACGVPLAVVEMTHQLNNYNVVDRNAVHKIYNEAGVNEHEWAWIIILAWAGLMMFRFISLGTHSFEGYIFAGMGMSVIMVLKFFLLRKN